MLSSFTPAPRNVELGTTRREATKESRTLNTQTPLTKTDVLQSFDDCGYHRYRLGGLVGITCEDNAFARLLLHRFRGPNSRLVGPEHFPRYLAEVMDYFQSKRKLDRRLRRIVLSETYKMLDRLDDALPQLPAFSRAITADNIDVFRTHYQAYMKHVVVPYSYAYRNQMRCVRDNMLRTAVEKHNARQHFTPDPELELFGLWTAQLFSDSLSAAPPEYDLPARLAMTHRVWRRKTTKVELEPQGGFQDAMSAFLAAKSGLDDSIISFLESLIPTVVLLRKHIDIKNCTFDTAAIMSTLALFVKASTRNNHSLTKKICSYIAGSILETDEPSTWAERFARLDATGNPVLEAQGLDEFTGGFDAMIGAFEMVRDSPFYDKISRIGRFMLTFSLLEPLGLDFDVCGFDAVDAAYVKRKHSSRLDFAGALIDFVRFFLETGVNAYREGDPYLILHKKDSVTAYIRMSTELDNKFKACKVNPQAHDQHFLQRATKEHVLYGERLLKGMKRTGSKGIDALEAAVQKVRLVVAYYESSEYVQDRRPTPFSLLLYGGSGVGKSNFAEYTFHVVGAALKLPRTAAYKYTRNSKDEYWSGYKNGAWALFLDDIACEHPNKESNSVDEVIQIVNTMACTPNMASLDEKGTTVYKGRYVVATTNVKHLNAHAHYAFPAAMQRRFPYVLTIEPKRPFATKDGRLDTDAVATATDKMPKGSPPDWWNVKVERVIVPHVESGKMGCEYERVANFTSIAAFSRWLSETVKKHDASEQRSIDSVTTMEEMDFCPFDSGVPAVICNCTQCKENRHAPSPKSDEEPVSLEPQGAIFGPSTADAWRSFAWDFLTFLLASVVIALYWDYYSIDEDVTMERSIYEIAMVLGLALTTVFGIRNAKQLWGTCRPALRAMLYIEDRFTDHPTYDPKKTAALLGAIVVLGAAYALYRQHNPLTPQIGTSPPPPDEFDAAPDPWKSDQTHHRPDLLQQPQSRCARDADLLRGKVEKATFRFSADGSHGHCLAIGGQIFVTFNHGMRPSKNFRLWNSIERGIKPCLLNDGVTITEEDIYRLPDQDICFFRVVEMQPFQDISRYFLKGPSITDEELGVWRMCQEAQGYWAKCTYGHSKAILHLDKKRIAHGGTFDVASRGGDCGTAYVGSTTKAIIGIHIAGEKGKSISEPGQGYCAYVTTGMCDAARKHFKTFAVAPERVNLSSDEHEVIVEPLHAQSCLRYIPEGTGTIYGSLPNRARPKSRVEDTPVARYLSDIHPKTFYQPVMKHWRPWNLAATAMTSVAGRFSTAEVAPLFAAFRDAIIDKLSVERLSKELFTLNYDEAINGIDGVKYVDALNKKTSMGAPWNKSKAHYCVETGEGDRVHLGPEIERRVNDMLRSYGQSILCRPLFRGSLKDEPTKKKKVEAGKTRVFAGAPVDFTIVCRMKLLCLCRLMMRNHDIFHASPGLNSLSKEWDAFWKCLTANGKSNLIAGDYKDFDKNMSGPLVDGASRMVRDLYEAAGATDEDLRVIECIFMDATNPIIELNGDILGTAPMNPSGWPLTTLLNCIVNVVYQMFAYVYNAPHYDHTVYAESYRGAREFLEKVTMRCFGDDVTTNPSPERCLGPLKNIAATDFFTHITIGTALESKQLVWTMAEKDAEPKPFLEWQEVTYLKRHSRYSEDHGGYVGALAIESIGKMLTSWVRNPMLDPADQMCSSFACALREAHFHGRDCFDMYFERIWEIIRKLEWSPWAEKYKLDTPYTTYVEEWKSAIVSNGRIIQPTVMDADDDDDVMTCQ